MMKKKITITIILLATAGILVYAGFLKSKTRDLPTVAVTRGDVIDKVTAVGSIVPVKTATVKSPISGTVAQLFHQEGDYVNKGDNLLEIKPEPTPDSYAKAKQDVSIDLAKERSDAADVARYRYLLKQGAISKNDQDYANARKQYQTDHLQRVLAQELLSLLEHGKATIGGRQIGNVITSPIVGFIVERAVNLGDPVTAQSDYQAGSDLLAIADLNELEFKGQVSETDAAKLHEGMPAAINIAALPDTKVSGTLTKLALQSLQASNLTTANTGSSSNTSGNNSTSPFNVGFTLEIGKLSLPSNIYLRAGYSATADIIVKRARQVLILPERVLQFEQDKAYVWLPIAKGQPKKQFIKLGLADGVNVQILEGLTLGEKVLENAPTSVGSTQSP